MPQMKPMNWFLLTLSITMLIIMLSSIMYFIKPTTIYPKPLKTLPFMNKYTWKW